MNVDNTAHPHSKSPLSECIFTLTLPAHIEVAGSMPPVITRAPAPRLIYRLLVPNTFGEHVRSTQAVSRTFASAAGDTEHG